ncbi:MAG TPA: 2-succinyl-5-enolpyruvyl-6-hydroxy-3-cyclohexene-1-carboxylic-acid synthase [Planctomycetota bacterium]|nr:2-succinyl-5-enolpyruvyl-6-hydroxy-3-cyclohexene-1-carboxylic-acid synthase [Planctomycetota bacterium]
MARDPNLNALWCRAIAEELRRGGVGDVVLCPGSRNAPLLFALAAAFPDAWSHVDERSGAFMALGAAKASGRPALVCVTSGSALANCAPALAEATYAGIPLIVVAADRPWELHERGAPQTMRQAGALAAFLDDELDLGEPTGDDAVIRALRARVSRIAQCRGPALIDVPLREPLTPAPDAAWDDARLSREAIDGRGGDRPYTALGATSGSLPPADLAWWGGELRGVDWLKPGVKGLIVCGANAAGSESTWPGFLAERTGFPLIADAPSNARRCEHAITLADALVTGPLGRTEPELIILVDQAPLSRAVYEYVGRQRCPLIVMEPGADRDFLANAWAAVPHPDAQAWQAIADACAPGDAEWSRLWRDAQRRAYAVLEAAMRDEPWGEVLAAHVAVTHPGFRTLHLASSMPVRHGNLHAPAIHVAVFANRGLNGIDGTLGTAIGAQRGDAVPPGLLLCGDLALLHDLPALAALAARPPSPRAHDLTIVVINNDGGGIFDFLPVAQAADYQRLVRTPHGLRFEHAARQFNLAYHAVRSREELMEALNVSAVSGVPRLIECIVDPGAAVERHRALVKALAGS